MISQKVVILLAFSICVSSALQLTEKKINNAITLTLVHDGEDAMMTHEEALKFCINLEKHKKKLSTMATTKSTEEKGASGTVPPLVVDSTTQVPTHEDGSEMESQSNLLSIHDPAMVAELMQWILNVERRQFWIGGMVKKVFRPFEHYTDHIIHMWTDGTQTDFRFLHFPNYELRELPEGKVRCLSVDYASGKWGVHDCKERMYFVCETIILPSRSSSMTAEASEVTEVMEVAAGGETSSNSSSTNVSTKTSGASSVSGSHSTINGTMVSTTLSSTTQVSTNSTTVA